MCRGCGSRFRENLYMRREGTCRPDSGAGPGRVTWIGATQDGPLDGRDDGGRRFPMLLGHRPSLRSDVLRTVHVLNPGNKSNDVAVTVTFKVASGRSPRRSPCGCGQSSCRGRRYR
jgi:hypothetical protein